MFKYCHHGSVCLLPCLSHCLSSSAAFGSFSQQSVSAGWEISPLVVQGSLPQGSWSKRKKDSLLGIYKSNFKGDSNWPCLGYMPDLDLALCQGGCGYSHWPACATITQMTCPSEDGGMVPQRRNACHNSTAGIHNCSNKIVLLASPHAPVSLFLGSMHYPPPEAWPSWLSDPTGVTHQ